MEAEVSFGAWVTRQRKALDLSRDQLAQCAGCSVSTLRKIEGDERRPSGQLAELLADCLQVSLDQRSTFLQVARGYLRVDRLIAARATPTIDHVSAVTSSQAALRLLPIPPTPFIGREAELATLARLLRDPQCRLLTLAGPGGIGKTRLALEVTSTQCELFSDGVCFVSLAPLTSPRFIVQAIANALGLVFSGSVDPQEQLLNYLREKRLLLVLDNLEHLLEGVDLLAELLQAPEVKLLVTSRERLNLKGEWLFDLQGLPVPPLDQVDQADESSAVALFVQSARRVQAGVKLKADDQPSVIRICQLVGGLPLAIELAAVWMQMLSCQEIVREIERNLDFLSVAMRDMPSRHHSMRAVFDQSWQMLSEAERCVLCRLSLFRGGFCREAAEQVAGATLDLISALMSKSFVRRTAADRYDLHELIRQYGLEKLQASGQYEETHLKHLTYLVALTQEAHKQLYGPQQAEWYNRLEQEHDNIRAALVWSFAPGATVERVECGLQLIVANVRFWQGRGHMREGVMWLERGLQANNSISLVIRANALSIAGWLVTYWGDCQRATAMLQESIALHRQLNNEPGLAKGLDILGDISWCIGDFATAKISYGESLVLFRKQGDPGNIGLSLYSAGRLHVDYGYYQEAEALLKEGLALLESIPDWRGIAMCHNGLGRLALLQGDPVSAAVRFGKALSLNYELGHKLAMVEILQELAIVALAMSQEPRAVQLWSAATALRESLGISFPSNDPIYSQASPVWLSKITSSGDWSKGRAMSLEQVIAYALASTEDRDYY